MTVGLDSFIQFNFLKTFKRYMHVNIIFHVKVCFDIKRKKSKTERNGPQPSICRPQPLKVSVENLLLKLFHSLGAPY